jgi:hypothetical protein
MGFDPIYQANSTSPPTPIIGCSIEYFPGLPAGSVDTSSKYNMPTSSSPYTLPTGYVFTISLTTTAGNVTQASFSIVGPNPTSPNNSKSWTETIPPTNSNNQSALAPIAAFQLNIVGKNGGDTAHMTSGAGKITYTSSTNNMTVVNVCPPCAISTNTAEQANSFYATLPPTPSRSIVQTFGVNPST